MWPSVPFHNGIHQFVADAFARGDISLRFLSGRPSGADLLDVRLGQLCTVMSAALPYQLGFPVAPVIVSALDALWMKAAIAPVSCHRAPHSDHIGNIVSYGPKCQVGGTATAGITANSMTYNQASGGALVVAQLPDNGMNLADGALVADLPVTKVMATSADPQPAPARGCPIVDLGKKTGSDRGIVPGHRQLTPVVSRPGTVARRRGFRVGEL